MSQTNPSTQTPFILTIIFATLSVLFSIFFPLKLAEMKAENLAQIQQITQAQKADDDDTPVEPDVWAEAFPEICFQAWRTNSARASLNYGEMLLNYIRETDEWVVVRPLENEVRDLGIQRHISDEESVAICTKLQPLLAPFSEEES